MEKRLFIIAAMCLMVMLAGCKKEEKSEPEQPVVEDSLTPFIGTFDLTIVTDSLQQSGSWISNSILPEGTKVPTRSGRLTITRSGKEGVANVLGRILITPDSVDYYRTTGTVDGEGRLQLAPGEDYVSASTMKGAYHFTFQPISKGETVSFKVDAEYSFNQGTTIERSTNTISNKR